MFIEREILLSFIALLYYIRVMDKSKDFSCRASTIRIYVCVCVITEKRNYHYYFECEKG